MSCRISIPLTVLEDPVFLSLREAFQPETMERLLPGLLRGKRRGGPDGSRGPWQLSSLRVFRHKMGKRCLVEYSLAGDGPDGGSSAVELVGKIRAKGPDHRTYALLRKLWDCGFDPASPDGIAIPEPLGMVDSCHLLVQRKVEGDSLEALLRSPESLAVAHRIAESAAKLHRLDFKPSRVHAAADELDILRDRFDQLLRTRPTLEARLLGIFEACRRLLAAFAPPEVCCIHRDFYPAQLILGGPLVYLLDFDLCSSGDPCLDMGNFLGHITEQSLRDHGHPGAYSCFELMLKERYLELTSVELRPRIRAYQIVTVARHLFLCTLKPERAPLFPLLLDWCEERLGLASGSLFRKRSGSRPFKICMPPAVTADPKTIPLTFQGSKV